MVVINDAVEHHCKYLNLFQYFDSRDSRPEVIAIFPDFLDMVISSLLTRQPTMHRANTSMTKSTPLRCRHDDIITSIAVINRLEFED